jgi:hypothetical protein
MTDLAGQPGRLRLDDPSLIAERRLHEVDVLLESPGTWTNLDDEELDILVYLGCAVHGCTARA